MVNTLPENTSQKEKEPNIDKTSVESEKLSIEHLQTLDNARFLKISPENRLQYITKQQNKSENLKEGDTLDFTFTYNGTFNRELWIKTTAGQVFMPNVKTLTLRGVQYERKELKGEFFSSDGSRLIINEGTQVEITKILSSEALEVLKKQKQDTYNELVKEQNYTKNLDIIQGAIDRGIDVDFALKALSSQLDGKGNSQRIVLLEDFFTEFDRIKGGFSGKITENNTYKDIFVLTFLRKINPDNYQKQALDFGISQEKIDNYKKSPHEARYLSPSQREAIVARAPGFVKSLVRKYFPPEEYENALLVCHGESGFNTRAINQNRNGTTDRGLFQINSIHSAKYAGKDIFDPETNTKIARQIFDEAGGKWRPWYAAEKIGLWN